MKKHSKKEYYHKQLHEKRKMMWAGDVTPW